MTLPKTMAEANQTRLATKTIEWNAVKTTDSVEVPLSRKPVLISVDNNDQAQALTVTLEHCIRVDDTNASAQIGEGDNGVVTVTVDEAGVGGEAYTIEVVVPEVEEASDLDVALVGTAIIITLGMAESGEEFIPDDTKNTAALIAAAIDALEDFSAEASGDGSTPITAAIEPVQFTGGTTEIWGSAAKADGTAIAYTATANARRVFGPVEMFPRFLKGRIVLTAGSAPADTKTTIVQVIEG